MLSSDGVESSDRVEHPFSYLFHGGFLILHRLLSSHYISGGALILSTFFTLY